MKNTLKKILTFALLSVLAISSLPAQTNLPAIATLSAKDTVELEKARIEAETEITKKKLEIEEDRISHREDARRLMVHDLAWNSWILAVLGSIFMCGIFRHQRNKAMQATVRMMVEKGQPITPELVNTLKSKNSSSEKDGNVSHKDFRSGLILTGIGIGVVMLCGKPGYIVLFIGLAFVLIGILKLGKGDN